MAITADMPDRPWDPYLTEHERAVLRQSGYGARQGFGNRPCLLVVDVTTGFVGPRDFGDLESNSVNPDSCGRAGWAAIDSIAALLDAARNAGILIVYTRGLDPTPDPIGSGRWADKNWRWHEPGRRSDALEIVSDIAPKGELVISKARPSAFYGSPLASLLVDAGIDSLLVVGTTTSGCIRATVLDGFNMNYKVSVVEECTFDRIQASHAINLLDMDLKYADVVSLSEVESYLSGLSDGLSRAAGGK